MRINRAKLLLPVKVFKQVFEPAPLVSGPAYASPDTNGASGSTFQTPIRVDATFELFGG